MVTSGGTFYVQMINDMVKNLFSVKLSSDIFITSYVFTSG